MDSISYHVTVGEYPATSAELVVQVRGLVVGVGVKVNLTPYSSTVDVSIVEENDNIPAQDVLVVTGVNADGWYYPVAPLCEQDGSLITLQNTIGVPVYGDVTIDVTNATPGDEVIITFRLE